jgi:hypothetical protein
VKVGDVLGRWTLLYRGYNAHGRPVWLCQCKCLAVRELRESALTHRSRCWSCGHRRTPTPGQKIGISSRYRGVTSDQARGLPRPWRAAMFLDGVHVFLGRYRTEEAAARAHDEAARVLLGPTAIVNFPRDEEG